MKTAEEMYQYCVDNETAGHEKNFCIKSFRLVEEQLSYDEEAEICFTGLLNYSGTGLHDFGAVYVFTNKHFFVARKGFFDNILQSIDINTITNLSQVNFGAICSLIVDSHQGVVRIGVYIEIANKLFMHIYNALPNVKNQSACAAPNSISSADEIRKYKELLDEGIITWEEFEAKKKQLLNL